MTTLPFVSAISYQISESHKENTISYKTGSYTVEIAQGIMPIESEYQIVWNLTQTQAQSLLLIWSSDPLALYDWVDLVGNPVKVIISNIKINPLTLSGSWVKISGTLKRRYL